MEILNSTKKDLGDGFIVRRCLPQRQRKMVGPFIFWDHMGPVILKPGSELKVRAHPHIGLATITYLFSGEIVHRDSLNNEQPIRPKEVNWMTAGRGIVHSERSPKLTGPHELEGIQLWVALPKDAEEIEPSFVHKKEEELPLLKIDEVTFRLIAGEYQGLRSPLPVYSSLFYLAGELAAGEKVTLPVDSQEEIAVYVARGQLKGGADRLSLKKGSMVVGSNGEPLRVEAAEDSVIMVLGGAPFQEGRHIWWNFVSSERERIEKAKKDWQEGRFPPVVNEDEWIPLPENK